MKTIKAYNLSMKTGHVLDVGDVVAAVLVYPSTGDVLLHTGELDGLAVAGSAIQQFWIKRTHGCLVLGFRFFRGRKAESVSLGMIDADDAPFAEDWIKHVNAVHRARCATMEARAADRTGALRVYPAVHDIIAERRNLILPGDYLRSPDCHPLQEYRPRWQELYPARCMARLQEHTGVSTKNIKPIWLTRNPHNYSYLADRIKYSGGPRFDARVTQPLEFMFDKSPRGDKIGVIPLCDCTHFAVAFLEGAMSAQALRLVDGECCYPSIEQLLRVFDEAGKVGPYPQIATQSNTSVDYLLNDLTMIGRASFADYKAEMPSIVSLGDWLLRMQGVVICDIGIAHQLRLYLKVARVGISLVPYDHPVPVGMAYRVDDPLWGTVCNEALQDTLTSVDPATCESIEDTKKRAKELCLVWREVA